MHELEQILKRLIEFGLLTNSEEEVVRRSMLAIEMQLQPKTRYIEFIDEFNTITKRKYKPDMESRDLYYENDALYSNTDRLTALKNALTDPWVKENSTALTPKWILKPENIAKYMNYAAPKSNSKSNKGAAGSTKPDYNDVTV